MGISSCWFKHTCDHEYGSSLTSSIVAQYSKYFPFSDRKFEIIDGGKFSKLLCQTVNQDRIFIIIDLCINCFIINPPLVISRGSVSSLVAAPLEAKTWMQLNSIRVWHNAI